MENLVYQIETGFFPVNYIINGSPGYQVKIQFLIEKNDWLIYQVII